jgi:hypothetical protein
MDNQTASGFPQAKIQVQRSRRWVTIAVQLIAGMIGAYAIFRFGVLWSLRGFAQAQPSPNPFLANFARYSIAVLWPIPGAVMLFLAAGGFRRRTPRWWVLLLAACVWFAAYLLVRPGEVYYYFLTPTST